MSFEFFLNVGESSVSLISGGRVFEMSGLASENALRPKCVLVRFMTVARVVDDGRRRTAMSRSKRGVLIHFDL